MTAFAGPREGRHPLLWVATDNNMVRDRGPTTRRYAPAPIAFDLASASREAVMDASPWTYRVSAEEARQWGLVHKVVPGRELAKAAREYAEFMAAKPFKALAEMKARINAIARTGIPEVNAMTEGFLDRA